MSLKSMDRKISLVLIIFSSFYLLLSYQLPSFPYVIVDADALPKGLGYLLLLLSLGLFIQNHLETEDEKKRRSLRKEDLKVLLLTLTFVIIYAILLEPIGFVLITIVFLLLTTRLLGYTKWVTNTIVSTLFTLGLYFSFNYFLQIYLPQGILPF